MKAATAALQCWGVCAWPPRAHGPHWASPLPVLPPAPHAFSRPPHRLRVCVCTRGRACSYRKGSHHGSVYHPLLPLKTLSPRVTEMTGKHRFASNMSRGPHACSPPSATVKGIVVNISVHSPSWNPCCLLRKCPPGCPWLPREGGCAIRGA